jgi:L-ribulose-5-phosphate 3-epimerase
MNNDIGVMQGRLLPKYQGRYQAHPLGYWQDEFFLAEKLGIDCIEFILDFNDAEMNPLLKNEGIKEIQLISQSTGVKVNTICADYFMEAPLHSADSRLALRSQQILMNLLNNAKELEVTNIVIPCVDQSALVGRLDAELIVERLRPCVEVAEKYEMNLCLETDLAPKKFVELLDQFNSNHVTVNYDIGNSAALGFDPVEELDAYGDRITDIHIKDREKNGGPVVLGKGAAEFKVFFNKLKEFDYQGPFIMQAYRDDEGVNIFKKQFEWISTYLNK